VRDIWQSYLGIPCLALSARPYSWSHRPLKIRESECNDSLYAYRQDIITVEEALEEAMHT